MAHTAGGALHFRVEDKKLAAVWEYATSPLYSEAERATLDFALAAASVPNAVTDAMFAELRKHWTEEQIVEIVGVIALFGFLNRWNDTMATLLEDEPIDVGQKYLAGDGWKIGKHHSGKRWPAGLFSQGACGWASFSAPIMKQWPSAPKRCCSGFRDLSNGRAKRHSYNLLSRSNLTSSDHIR